MSVKIEKNGRQLDFNKPYFVFTGNPIIDNGIAVLANIARKDDFEDIIPNDIKKIRNLSIIGGAEGKYTEFLAQLKEENKQRPSFLDEMGKILE